MEPLTLFEQYLAKLIEIGGFAKKMTTWMEYIPGICGITLGKTCYLDPAIWNTVDGAAALAHETEHVKQVAQYGVFGFYRRWGLSRTWRFRFELAGYRADVEFDKLHRPNKALDTVQWAARALSGSATWWSASYERAFYFLTHPDEQP